MTISQIPIWLDCDPGHDDAFAILLALYSPHFNVLGISTVFGNAPVEHTTYNTLSLLTALQKTQIPVYKGASHAIHKKPVFATDIHGKSGLGDHTLLPLPEIVYQTSSYIEAMREAIIKNEGQISIAATGTLTNIYELFLKYPELKSKVKYISIMGGAIGLGNWTSFAEFNFFVDSYACDAIVTDIELKDKLVLVPLNLTHKAIATKEVELKILYPTINQTIAIEERQTTKIRKIYYELITSFTKVYKKKRGFMNGPPVHDPLTLAVLLHLYNIIDLEFAYKKLKITVVSDSTDKDGMSVVGTMINDSSDELLANTVVETNTEESIELYEDDSEGIMIGFDMNIDKFWGLVYDSLDQCDLLVE